LRAEIFLDSFTSAEAKDTKKKIFLYPARGVEMGMEREWGVGMGPGPLGRPCTLFAS